MDLSVIIPGCDRQRYIAACLRSVTRCSREHMDMECLVVGGGMDETAAIVNRYAQRDSRIKMVVTGDAGISGARNAGIEKASGKYILFLDAADRLCEDAWEQIEAAVCEEYADFVAFSHVTSRRNGRLKAQMLPISDVVSTDENEARMLMYADSVLHTCDAKLFKNRIIRDNNIFFMSDAPAAMDFCDFCDFYDFYFVAEYFEHCESYLMTRAMILYCPQRDKSAAADYSIGERLERLGDRYDFQAGVVDRYHDDGLTRCMQVYYLGVLADLFCGYAVRCGRDRVALETIYAEALENKFVKRLLDGLDEQWIHSGIKRHEYRLLRKGNTARMRRYFRVRAGIQSL